MDEVIGVSEIGERLFCGVGGAWIISAEVWLWYFNVPKFHPSLQSYHLPCKCVVLFHFDSGLVLWPVLGNGLLVRCVLSTDFLKGLAHLCLCNYCLPLLWYGCSQNIPVVPGRRKITELSFPNSLSHHHPRLLVSQPISRLDQIHSSSAEPSSWSP